MSAFRYRPHLDGLRAIAVLVVIFYHIGLGGFRGGFLGVDVFFVLSGYLITRLLLLERENTGRIDFWAFYARRSKRLLPALYLLLFVLAVTSGVLFAATMTSIIARDSLASIFYVANWSFVFNEQSYFELSADPSPLRHMWSLAVEEQFYMLWPVLVLVLPKKTARSMMLIAVAALASAAALALLYDPSEPSRAYYGTDARIHEPLIGAFAAFIASSSLPRLQFLRHLVLPSFALMLAFIPFLGDQSPGYYQGLSMVFSLNVAILLLGLEVDGPQPLRRLLSSRLLVWLGKISYGMYLWHWPIALLVEKHNEASKLAGAGVTLVATILASVVSFYLLERPVRRAKSIAGIALTARRTFAAAALVAMALALPLWFQLQKNHAPKWASTKVSTVGNGSFTIALVGDSIIRSLAPAFEAVALKRGWTIIDASIAGCSVAGGFQINAAGKPYSFSNHCAKSIPRHYDILAKNPPDLIFWHSATETNRLLNRETEETHSIGSKEHDQILLAGWRQSIARFNQSQIVIISTMYKGPRRGRQCQGEHTRCPKNESMIEAVDHVNALLGGLVESHENIQFVPIGDYVCSLGPPCPRAIDGMTLREDGVHYTSDSAEQVVKHLLAKIKLPAKAG